MKTQTYVALFGALTFATLSVAAETNMPASAPATPSKSPATVVARVNGVDITRGQLDESMQEAIAGFAQQGQTLPPGHEKEMESKVLDQLITQQLIFEKCKGIKVDNLDTKIKAQQDQIRKRLPDEKAYASWLKTNNLTEEKLKNKIMEGIQVEALFEQVNKDVQSKTQVTADEIKQFYDSHAKNFERPAQIRASHILVLVPQGTDEKVRAEKKAAIDKARERVLKGENFAKVAAEVSEDPGSKTKGGDLDYFGRGMMVKPFDEAAFGLKSNEVSQVVTTEYGYHIIKQTDSRSGSTVPLEEVKPKIEQYILQQKSQQGLIAYVEDLKKQAKIEVLMK